MRSFRQRFDDGDLEAAKVGEAVILAIDLTDDTAKLQLLAHVFRAWLGGALSYVDFRRIYLAIQTSTVSDILELCQDESPTRPLLERLVGSGLTEMSPGALSAEGTPVFLHVRETTLGATLRKIVRAI